MCAIFGTAGIANLKLIKVIKRFVAEIHIRIDYNFRIRVC